jgi:hypothetical protein
MKTRQLIRKHGWTPVNVDALKIVNVGVYTWNQSREERNENTVQYWEIVSWCKEVLGSGNYACTLQHGGSSDCEKKFVFKYPKHATMFRMRWCT